MELQLITTKIYEIRGQRVMLDADLAELYDIETKVLNQSVRRNKDRFPKDFMFIISDLEYKNLKSQIVTSSWGGKRKSTVAFTEHGVTMLAIKALTMAMFIFMAVSLRSTLAMRRSIVEIKDVSDQLALIKERIGAHDVQLNEIYTVIENLLDDNV